MTEIRTPMIPIKVDKACECAAGRMRPSGFVRASMPAQHQHYCNKCGNEEYYHQSYPYITYEPTPEDGG